MSERALTDPAPAPGPPLGESRARVLDVLRASDRPLGVQEIADRTGLHPNTARFHLDALVGAGLVERAVEDRSGPGRPPTVYRALAEDVPDDRRSYRLLAEMLTGLVGEALPRPGAAAVAAGEAWGRYLVDRPAPGQRVDEEEAIRRLTKVLTEAGFSPGDVEPSGRPVVPLRHCPFREVAEQHREVVCSLHLGLMRGALAEVRAPLGVERLEPFVEPSLCLAHLVPAPEPSAASAGEEPAER